MTKKRLITKGFWWKLLLIAFGYLGVLFGVFFYALNRVETKTASALEYETMKFEPQGTTTYDGTTITGCPKNFQIYMYGTYMNDETGWLYDGDILNWYRYSVNVETQDVSDHLSFVIYKNGYEYLRKDLSGSGDMSLCSEVLDDGVYTIEYKCRYRKNIFYSYTTYTFSYTFEVDKLSPTYTLKSNGNAITSGGYTNKSIEYRAADRNFCRIDYQKPGNSKYFYEYGYSYTVAATEANNGLWTFRAMDWVGNTSSTVRVFLDTIAPVGTVTNQDENVIANGGATNTQFIYSATDARVIESIQYKSPKVTTWTTYPKDVSILTSNGWYYFRAIDKAGNVSDEYRVYYDTTRPLGAVYDANTAKGSGSVTNKSYVKYIASDSGSGIASVYVQKPGSSSFVSYTNGSQLTAPGKYKFKAYDKAGNVTSTIHEITLDLTAPVGQLKAGGVNVANGSYTSKPFSYTATDAVGIAICQYKKPNSSEWLTYTQGTNISSTEGWYYFKATDTAGNVSAESKIFYDVSKPDIYLIGGPIGGSGVVQTSGAVVNSECIRATAVDTGSGIASFRVWGDNYSSAVAYTSGTELTKEGRYYFDATNKAGISSGTYRLILDKTGPTGTIYCENTKWDGTLAVTGADYIRFEATDSLAGVKACYVLTPGATQYVECDSAMEFTEEGKYFFYAVDFINNSSPVYSITINHTAPKGNLYINGELALENNGYTNAEYISFIFNEGRGYVIPPNASSSQYISGTTYSAEGKYAFWAENEGGQTGVMIVIDRTPKELTLTGVRNGYADGNVEISWTNGNPNVDAPVDTITINGKLYDGGTIYTLNGATYEVVCTDKAGNVWKTQFTGRGKEIATMTLQKEYWEVKDGWSDYVYSFSKYENALMYATTAEKRFVTMKTWNTVTWDQGIPMDTKDSVNAQNGNYYIYKSEEDAEKQVAYFTQERLDEVVKKYAEKTIQHWYYFEKVPESCLDGDLNAYPDENKIVATEVELREGLIYTLDGEPYAEFTIKQPGAHTLLIEDGYGANVEYEIYILNFAPTLQFALGENEPSNADYDRTYYFNGKVTLSIPMEGDEFAMFVVYYENGDEVGYFDIENACYIEESGIYSAMAVNHYGETEEFKFVVSMNAPMISMQENAENKTLDIVITDSIDKVSQVTFIEIAKSDDGGETWIALTEDDYGKEISVDTLKYNFRTSGMYRVTVMDEFRTGIDALTQTITYEQPIPEATLAGVEHEGYTNKPVTFTWKDEAIVEVLKDGQVIDYASGQELTEDGFYRITFANYNGYREIYSFTIDTALPVIATEGANHREAVNEDVKVFYTEENLTAELYKDGKLLGNYVSGNPISADGQYRVRVYDLAGNEVSVEFTIDKTVEYEINVYNGGLANSVVATSHETITTELLKNGEKVDYALGGAIVEPADYTLVLIDALGNKDVISFHIINPLAKEFTHNFDDIEGFGGVLVNGEDKRLNYGTLELFDGGKYEVGVIVGGVTYSFTVTVDATAPTLVLNGVDNGGSTKNGVTLTALSETATVKVYLNGEEIAYTEGDVLQTPGDYKVVLEDVCGNVNEYNFTIQKTLSGAVIALIVIGGIAFVGAIVFFVLKKKKVF